MDVLNRHAQLTPDESRILDRVLEDEDLVGLGRVLEEAHASYLSAGG
jgi:hypothetical protein